MKVASISAVVAGLLSLPTVTAFIDTSPLFLFSSVELPASVKAHSLSFSAAEDFTQNVIKVLEACTSDAYIIVSQPGLHAADFSHKNSAPELRRRVGKRDQKVLRVDHAVGSVDTAGLKNILIKSCGAHEVMVDASTSTFGVIENNMRPSIIPVDFSKLPSDGKLRAKKLREHDVLLSALLTSLPTDKFTVVYTSTPVDDVDAVRSIPQEHDTVSPVHPAVSIGKRQFTAQAPANNTGSIFQRYQFFTTGIFLTLITILVLSVIFMAGLTGLSSIQVSYGAFEKEMGPAEQRKKQ